MLAIVAEVHAEVGAELELGPLIVSWVRIYNMPTGMVGLARLMLTPRRSKLLRA